MLRAAESRLSSPAAGLFPALVPARRRNLGFSFGWTSPNLSSWAVSEEFLTIRGARRSFLGGGVWVGNSRGRVGASDPLAWALRSL